MSHKAALLCSQHACGSHQAEGAAATICRYPGKSDVLTAGSVLCDKLICTLSNAASRHVLTRQICSWRLHCCIPLCAAMTCTASDAVRRRRQEELASAEALPAPAALDLPSARDGDDAAVIRRHPTSSKADACDAAPLANVTPAAESCPHRYDATGGMREEAERPSRTANAEEGDTEDALIAALQGDRHELLQRVSSMTPVGSHYGQGLGLQPSTC